LKRFWFIWFSVFLLPVGIRAGQEGKSVPPTAPAGMVYLQPGIYEPLFKNEGVKNVSGFFLDIYPVTNTEYLKFVQSHPRWRKSKVKAIFADESYLAHWKADLDFGDQATQLQNSPVVHVSWFAARAYAKWVGKRLPIQAEWEYAAAASQTRAHGKEDPEHYKYILSWYSKPTPEIFPSVGSTYKNYWGLYDLHGLVWEWVSDFNTALVTGESRGDTGFERELFCGSGSLGASNFQDYAAFMRYAFRSSLKANYTTMNLGFRCALDTPKP